MKEIENSLQIRDYEIERIYKKILGWYPQFNEDGLRSLIEFTNINMSTIFFYVDDEELMNAFVHASLKYCMEIISHFYGIKFSDDQVMWIAKSMISLVEDITSQLPYDNDLK